MNILDPISHRTLFYDFRQWTPQENWGTLGLQAVKALLGSIPAKDINSSNFKVLNMPFFSLIQDFVLRNDL
jgi:hypothetical protein